MAHWLSIALSTFVLAGIAYDIGFQRGYKRGLEAGLNIKRPPPPFQPR